MIAPEIAFGHKDRQPNLTGSDRNDGIVPHHLPAVGDMHRPDDPCVVIRISSARGAR